MPITANTEKALDLAFNGTPFMALGPGANTTLDLAFNGQPFIYQDITNSGSTGSGTSVLNSSFYLTF